MRPRHSLLLVATALAAAAAPAVHAHHSFAGYDRAKKVTLEGTVKEFQFVNPHAWIDVNVAEQGAQPITWAVECGSPNMMARTGWKKSSLKAGDRVVVVVNPLLDGRPSGSLVTITLPDGTVLGPGDAPPPKPLGAPAGAR